MRSTLRIDEATAALFALEPVEAAGADAILARLGADAPDRLAAMAFALPEKSLHAACWRALRAPYPWPWLAAELDSAAAEASEEHAGCKLLCAVALHCGPPCDELPTPAQAVEDLAALGVACSPSMACPWDLASMSHHARRALALSLEAGGPARQPPRLARAELSAWALPILYRPSRHGPYGSMPAKERGLLAQSCSDILAAAFAKAPPNAHGGPSLVLLGLGPFRSILARAPSLCAPLSLRAQIAELSGSLFIPPADLAVSVSFHKDPEADPSEWMRIALRPADTGFRLGGIDWPIPPGESESEFDRLLDTLGSCGIEWCHQVQGSFGPLMCPECGEPVYPAPAHEPWAKAAREAGTPPDGSHLH